MTAAGLVEAARSVGLTVEQVDETTDAPLYVWVTPEHDVIYVGKAASPRRFSEEAAWVAQDPTRELFSAFVALVRRQRGRCQPIRLVGFDPAAAREAARTWTGGAFDSLGAWLNDDRTLTAEDAETLLIRILVRCGVPIGNSRNASQWDHPLGAALDTLAAVAASEVLSGLENQEDEVR